MQHGFARAGWLFIVLMFGTVLLLWSATSFAASPTLGPDCGVGAGIVGSDSAGKVTLGTPAIVGDPMAGTCTLSFTAQPLNPPACTAMNETNGGGYAVGLGTRTTTVSLQMDATTPWVSGDVVSYSCTAY